MFLIPAKALLGKSVKRPKGKKDYVVTEEPTESMVNHENITQDDFYFSDIVYLNSEGYSTAWLGSSPVKCQLTKQELVEFRDRYNLDDDYNLRYMRGNLQVNTTWQAVLK